VLFRVNIAGCSRAEPVRELLGDRVGLISNDLTAFATELADRGAVHDCGPASRDDRQAQKSHAAGLEPAPNHLAKPCWSAAEADLTPSTSRSQQLGFGQEIQMVNKA
jgi:hypothetical protein